MSGTWYADLVGNTRRTAGGPTRSGFVSLASGRGIPYISGEHVIYAVHAQVPLNFIQAQHACGSGLRDFVPDLGCLMGEA